MVSLGIFSVVPSDKTTCPGVDSAHENEYDPPRKSGALTYLEPLGPPRPDAGNLYFTLLFNGHLMGGLG